MNLPRETLFRKLGPISYTALNQMLDASFPKLALNYWKSCFVSELSDDVIAVLREQFARCPSPMSKLILEHFHGVALQPKPTDMAFPHRDPGYSVLIIAQWSDPQDGAANVAWAKETFTALAPFTRHGAYSNYMGDDEPLSGVKHAFGENLPRLQKLKGLTVRALIAPPRCDGRMMAVATGEALHQAVEAARTWQIG